MTQQATEKKQEKYSIQTADPVWLREEADRVIRFFADRLRDVDIVREVRFTYEVHGVTGWVIADPPDRDYRSEDPIMQVVGEAIDIQRVPLFDFRIINLKRIPKGNPLNNYVPPESETLWKRRDA